MKNLWLFIAAIAIISCKPEKEIEYSLISGKIENTDAEKITIYSQFDTSQKTEINIAANGTFSDTLKMDTDFYIFREGKNSTILYAPNGSDVNITYNAKEKDSTITFKGNTTAINNYLIEKKRLSKDLISDNKTLYSKEEAAFKEEILAAKSAKENLLVKTDAIPEDFKIKENKHINYEYLATLNNYPSYHGYYIRNRDFKASENFLDELKNVEIENESDFLYSSYYRNIVGSKLREKANDLVEKDSTLSRDIAYLKAISELKSQKMKNKLLFEDALYGITYTDNLEEYYAIFSENSTNEKNNEKIAVDYKKLKSLAKGNPSPQFTNYENNAGGTKSLSDLKGKYVYIDVWATWCGPCIAEIPSLKKIEKEFHDKNIQFLSISIDEEKDHDKWKKMIVDRELGGMQLMADNNWESQFIEDYMIKGIPRFILLDPQGNIVTANAPRPSNEKLVTLLNELDI
ncbi:TlpA family protein disulfide reductase [Polaribacter aestuariivivens]|uniref:TlpA family protein disulfide reductase n=1 Tax=Polaribacter aestuariivivens TaxID=2304626 RepID=UPI003F4956DF